jgi:hypothetical protein
MNALEHAFGKARIQCSDVNTMPRMMRGFASETLSLSVNTPLQIVSAPRPRRSIGLDCVRYPSLILLPSRAVPKRSLYRYFFKLGPISHLFSSIPISCNNMCRPLWYELFLIPEFMPAMHPARLILETHVGPMTKGHVRFYHPTKSFWASFNHREWLASSLYMNI